MSERELPRRNVELFPDLHPPLDAGSAVTEAHRCLDCFDAPCMNACPTHIDGPGFIKRIASGNVEGAARLILRDNILGMSCSRACPVEVLCEGSCVMHAYNRKPIEIGRLQRFAMDDLADRAARGGSWGFAAPSSRRGRVACIGGGPAHGTEARLAKTSVFLKGTWAVIQEEVPRYRCMA